MLKNFDNTASLCSTCPRRRNGVCKILVQMLKQHCIDSEIKRLPVKAKQHLFRQGDQSHDAFIVREGWIQLYRMTEEGRRQVFPAVLAGEIVGLHVDNNTHAHFSAVALTDTLICKIPNFVNLCLADSNLALRLAETYELDSLTAEMYLANVAQCGAKERIAFLVMELYRRLAQRKLNNGLSIPFPLKQADIADTLGLTSVHVSRTLESMKENGLLEMHKQTLTILDYPKLNALVGEYLEPIGECDLMLC